MPSGSEAAAYNNRNQSIRPERSSMKIRVMIDTMIHDTLVFNSELRLLMQKLQADNIIALLSTRIQEDQLSAIPPTRARGQKSVIQTTRISPAVFIFDFSILDEDRFGSDEANAAYERLRGENSNHVEDAVIGATAFNDADILVTNDKKFGKRFATIGCATRVMTDSEFQKFLMTLT